MFQKSDGDYITELSKLEAFTMPRDREEVLVPIYRAGGWSESYIQEHLNELRREDKRDRAVSIVAWTIITAMIATPLYFRLSSEDYFEELKKWWDDRPRFGVGHKPKELEKILGEGHPMTYDTKTNIVRLVPYAAEVENV